MKKIQNMKYMCSDEDGLDTPVRPLLRNIVNPLEPIIDCLASNHTAEVTNNIKQEECETYVTMNNIYKGNENNTNKRSDKIVQKEEGELDSDEEEEVDPTLQLSKYQDIIDKPVGIEFFNDLLNTEEVIKTEHSDNNECVNENIPTEFFDELLPNNTSPITFNVKHEETFDYSILESKQNEPSENQTKSPINQNKRYWENEKRSRSFNVSDNNEYAFNAKRTCYHYETENAPGEEYLNYNVSGFNTERKQNDEIKEEQIMTFKRIKLTISKPPDVHNEVKKNQEDLHELTPKEKKQRAVQRVQEVLELFKKYSNEEAPPPLHKYGFLHTSTVRKLPTICHTNEHNNDYCSPLTEVSNVSYKFNSHVWNPDKLRNWNLETLSPTATRLARLLCYDINALYDKIGTIKFPASLQKARKMADEKQRLQSKLEENNSTLFNSVATQTDYNLSSLSVGNNDAPNIHTKSSIIMTDHSFQTNGIVNKFINLFDLPTMQLMCGLSNNKLIALQDFTEIMLNPQQINGKHLLQNRLMDIYNFSQMAPTTNYQSLQSRHFSSHDSSRNQHHDYRKRHSNSGSNRDRERYYNDNMDYYDNTPLSSSSSVTSLSSLNNSTKYHKSKRLKH